MFNKTNFKEWFNRYKFAELAAITAALVSSQFYLIFDGLVTAYLITFSEYTAFYGVILFMAFDKVKNTNILIGKRTTYKDIIFVLQNLILEFGYPSILDFFVIRPFCMYWMPILSGNYVLGIFLGKIIADFIFYSLAILNYELLKNRK